MNKQDDKSRLIILITGIFIGVLIVTTLIFTGTTKNSRNSLKVGYVLNASVDQDGWNRRNYEGIKKACDDYKCKLYLEQNIAENSGMCRKAVQRLLDKNVNVIFLSSSFYASEVQDLIEKSPKVLFYSNSASFEKQNLTTYFVKMYQTRYLTGILAGYTTKTNEIGYIAAMPTSEVNRGIDAFTMGVKRANKDAKVIVKWTNAWDDYEAEKKAVEEFANNTEVDILTYHVNKPEIVYMANEHGIKSIGYHVAINDVENCLTSIVCDWSLVYERILSAILSGRNNHSNYYWLGLEDGVIRLTDFSPLIENETQIKVEAVRSQLLYGYNIFSGEIYDNEGVLRCAEDEALIDRVLLDDINWLVEGVEQL